MREPETETGAANLEPRLRKLARVVQAPGIIVSPAPDISLSPVPMLGRFVRGQLQVRCKALNPSSSAFRSDLLDTRTKLPGAVLFLVQVPARNLNETPRTSYRTVDVAKSR